MKKQFYSCMAAFLFIPSIYGQIPSNLVPRDLPTIQADTAVATQVMNKVEKKIGSSAWNTLLEAKKVEAFRLDGHSPDTTENAVGGFKVLAGKVLLNEAQKDTLIQHLTAEANYFFDSFSKSCDFYPDIAFKVGDKMLITASLTCDLWKFETEGLTHSPIYDLDNAHKPMLDLALTLFPDMLPQAFDAASYNNADTNAGVHLLLEIEARETTTPKAEILPESPKNKTAKTLKYKVVKGDNLTKIAKKHDVTIQELMEWNEKESDLIKIDEELIVSPRNNAYKGSKP